jgi:hypothetical protein
MSLPTIFDTCTPRADVLDSTIAEADFAADLAKVIRNEGSLDYRDPVRFFSQTYPTIGLRNLLQNVLARLTGDSSASAAIFRLDTSYGGGKTHGLIALAHAARGMKGVKNVKEFIESKLIPKGNVRIAAFDGENSDPANGRKMGDGVLAHSPWGELAYTLAGKAGYDRVRKSDETHTAPGAETLAELFGGEPCLILLDELSVYLRKVANLPGARDQLSAFLTSLFKAVESSPRVALVYTLAIGKDGKTGDAYSTENQFIADKMAEAESISARKATLLNPTEDHETVHVLLRRLFDKVDVAKAAPVIEAYRELWQSNKEALPPDATHPDVLEAFGASYPLHPELLETLKNKTSTLANFQRVRGMLRLLARTIAQLWKTKPGDATAIHLHHIDLGYEPIRQEIFTKLGRKEFTPAVNHDIAGGAKKALAQELDTDTYKGLAPYGTYVGRTIFLHSLAFNEPLKGLSPEELRFSILGPLADVTFIDDARKRFVATSAFLDDRPGVPLRFLAEANLTQIIRRQEQHVDTGDARGELNIRIRDIFSGSSGGSVFEMVPFPIGPNEVGDEVGDGRPRLVVMAYDAVTVGATVESVPELIGRIFTRKGADGAGLRSLRNHLVFLVADDSRIGEMRQKMVRRMALAELVKPDRLTDLADHQQRKVRELEGKSELEVATAVQQAYRHLFYPSRFRLGAGDLDLGHAAIDIHSASERPGSGQQQVVRTLRESANQKLRLSEDPAEAPGYIRDRTPLKKGQISTAALREEFRRDPSLSIHASDSVLIRAITQGITQGDYVYRRGDLLCGPGDPMASILIDEQSFVFTMQFAKEKGIWPRPAPAPTPGDAPPGDTGGTPPTDGGSTWFPPGETAKEDPRQPAPPSLTAEGVLKAALAELWEKARKAEYAQVNILNIRLFDAVDAFRMIGSVNAEKGCTKHVKLAGGYVTQDGGEMQLEFTGSPGDAMPVKDFLGPQLNAARDRTVEATFILTFDPGLQLAGDAPEKLAERLSKFASGAAYVTATAEATA